MRINTTLIFFLLLVPLSGFIAWAGDRIGHKIGKRRQSLFGLRPRHTATFITVSAGIGIATASFGLMLALSEGFRSVIAHGSELLQMNRQLTRDNARMQDSMRDAGRRVRELLTDATEAERQRHAAETARDTAINRRRDAETNYARARRDLDNAALALDSERARLGKTQSSLDSAQKRVAEANARLSDASLRQKRAEVAARQAETDLKQARTDAADARAKVVAAEKTFAEVTATQRRTLTEQREKLRLQTEQLQKQDSQLVAQTRDLDEKTARAERQGREIDRQKRDLAQLALEVSALQERRLESQQALDDLLRNAVALRRGNITYRVGEEVARMTVAPGVSVWRVQGALEGLLTAAAKKAEARGAKTPDGAIRAVLIPERLVNREDGPGTETIREMDSLRVASMSIRQANEPVVVIVVATANAVAGEAVPVDLKTFRNPVVLTAGAPLGEISLDGTRSRQEVADSLYAFLRGAVRKKLLAAGVIPMILGGDADDAAVGETGIDSVLKVLDDIRSARRAKVTVRAARDLRAADPVALEFEVRAIEAPPIVLGAPR